MNSQQKNIVKVKNKEEKKKVDEPIKNSGGEV